MLFCWSPPPDYGLEGLGDSMTVSVKHEAQTVLGDAIRYIDTKGNYQWVV
jgi:hypothetical protein